MARKGEPIVCSIGLLSIRTIREAGVREGAATSLPLVSGVIRPGGEGLGCSFGSSQGKP